MANPDLEKSKIAFADGFERVELNEPHKALDGAGATTVVVSPKRDQVRSWEFADRGNTFSVDVDSADAQDFDAFVLPGGALNPVTLRIIPKAVDFMKAFFEAGKPVAAICHGPCTLIEAGAAKGRRMTSWPSLRSDLKNAGAEWVDGEAVVDKSLLTSSKPDIIPAFNREAVKLFSIQIASCVGGG